MDPSVVAPTGKHQPGLAFRGARAALLGALLCAFVSGPLAAAPCDSTATQLCLGGDRFSVEVAWKVPGFGAGPGQAVPLTADTGLFWFFGNSNLELMVKVLDGRLVNGHFWVYWGSLSSVEYTITVTDTKTGARKVYSNPPGQLASRADTEAFGPEPPSSALPSSALAAFGGLSDVLPPLAVPLRQGPELQVNVTTNSSQSNPGVAVGPDGGFMITWTDDARGPDVWGRLYDAAGRPRGGEFPLSSAGPRFRFGARVAASPTGERMTVWVEPVGAANLLMGRVFGSDGRPLGEDFRLGSHPLRPGFPAIIADPAGGFLVAWPGGGDSSVAPSLHWQRFDPRGGLVGLEVTTPRPAAEVGLAASSTGGFLMAWIEPAVGLLESDVLALRLDAQARPIGDVALRVNTDLFRQPGLHSQPVPIAHADGEFSIVWSTEVFRNGPGTPGLFARRYTAAGNPAAGVVSLLGGARRPYGRHAAVALPFGDALVTWSETDRIEDRDGGLFGQLFDGSWNARGDAFRINTYTQFDQSGAAVAGDGAGRLVVAWDSGFDPPPFEYVPSWGDGTQDGNFYGVFAQRFTTATCALDSGQLCLGGRFRVAVELTNPWTGQPQAAHAVPMTADTGAFWFFGADNLELVIKVLDGRPVNGRFWVFYGALSDVGYTITVTDMETGQQRTYRNDPGRLASRADVAAFPTS